MKRIVWLFGDGSTQYTALDPSHRLENETEEEQIARYRLTVGPNLRVSPVKTDLTVRLEDERQAYEATLGDGAKATFAGVIEGDEYETKRLGTWRAYREAWTWTTQEPVIDIDMEVAREIHTNRLRAARTPILADLDVQFMRAVEAADAKAQAAISAKKQALRDVTKDPAIEAALTPEVLTEVVPDVLQ